MFRRRYLYSRIDKISYPIYLLLSASSLLRCLGGASFPASARVSGSPRWPHRYFHLRGPRFHCLRAPRVCFLWAGPWTCPASFLYLFLPDKPPFLTLFLLLAVLHGFQNEGMKIEKSNSTYSTTEYRYRMSLPIPLVLYLLMALMSMASAILVVLSAFFFNVSNFRISSSVAVSTVMHSSVWSCLVIRIRNSPPNFLSIYFQDSISKFVRYWKITYSWQLITDNAMDIPFYWELSVVNWFIFLIGLSC